MAIELSAPELFPHVRIVMGMVVGLGITRLLTGTAGFVQHPGKQRPYPVHLLWVLSLLIEMVHFWWWEFALFDVPAWTFGIYAFLIAYAIILYLMCALLFPDNIDEYDGYEGFFISRRRWFYGLFACTFLFDVVDTMIKGPDALARFGVEYAIQVPVGVALCLVGAWTGNRRFHLAFVIGHILYQLSWIGRLYYTIA